jgi:hypothetical protein
VPANRRLLRIPIIHTQADMGFIAARINATLKPRETALVFPQSTGIAGKYQWPAPGNRVVAPRNGAEPRCREIGGGSGARGRHLEGSAKLTANRRISARGLICRHRIKVLYRPVKFEHHQHDLRCGDDAFARAPQAVIR